jgi:hypothetical protein
LAGKLEGSCRDTAASSPSSLAQSELKGKLELLVCVRCCGQRLTHSRAFWPARHAPTLRTLAGSASQLGPASTRRSSSLISDYLPVLNVVLLTLMPTPCRPGLPAGVWVARGSLISAPERSKSEYIRQDYAVQPEFPGSVECASIVSLTGSQVLHVTTVPLIPRRSETIEAHKERRGLGAAVSFFHIPQRSLP